MGAPIIPGHAGPARARAADRAGSFRAGDGGVQGVRGARRDHRDHAASHHAHRDTRDAAHGARRQTSAHGDPARHLRRAGAPLPHRRHRRDPLGRAARDHALPRRGRPAPRGHQLRKWVRRATVARREGIDCAVPKSRCSRRATGRRLPASRSKERTTGSSCCQRDGTTFECGPQDPRRTSRKLSGWTSKSPRTALASN